jgi:hypothetical protein
MRKLALSLIVAFAFYVTAAAAQAGGGMSPGTQGRQGSSPGMQQPGSTQPGAQQPGQPGQPPDMGPGNDQTGTTNAKSEKKLKGCVESQNGQYVLMTKKGNVALAGQDVSAHVGHEVAVKGMWDNSGSNANASPTASSSGNEAWSKGTFNVTEVKMESEQCKIKSKDHSGAGTGTNGAGTGSNSGSGTGSTTTPPQ